MSDYLYSSFIEDKRISIRGIPAILLRQRDSEAKLATVIFYHGWSSNKESQRIRGLILAAMGFQVLIPDAIYHGERDSINHNTAAGQYFWEVIFKSMEEAD
ncbi:MAG: phospholipase, partial [Tissierellaceae bacterium]